MSKPARLTNAAKTEPSKLSKILLALRTQRLQRASRKRQKPQRNLKHKIHMRHNLLAAGILAALPGFYMKPDTGNEVPSTDPESATGTGSPVTTNNPFTATHPVVDTQAIEIKKLVLDAGTQPRVAIDDETVKEYTEVIKSALKGEQPIPFPPITVFRDPTGRCVPADGFHRIAAHKSARVHDILCEIREGTERDALLFCCGANATHGVKRTNKDKQRAVKIVLNDPEWVQLPNTDIARLCAVSEGMIREMRSVAKSPAVRKVTIRGKQTTMDTSAIGKGKGGGKKAAKAAAKKGGGTEETKPTADAKGKNSDAAELDRALTKIANAVGGDEGGKIRKAVHDGALEIPPKDVKEWASFSPSKIKAVAPLITGGSRMKPAKAFEFLASELSDKIVTELHNRALGGGGKFEFETESVKITVVHKGK